MSIASNIVRLIREHPEDWQQDRFTFWNKKANVGLWVANGLPFLSHWLVRDDSPQFRLGWIGAWRVWMAYRWWQAWRVQQCIDQFNPKGA